MVYSLGLVEILRLTVTLGNGRLWPASPQGRAELSDDMVPGRGVSRRVGVEVGRKVARRGRDCPSTRRGRGRALSMEEREEGGVRTAGAL